MSGSTFGHLFRVTNFGESHGPAIGCVIDGCPPGMALSEADIQPDLDRRRPGTSRHVTQRNEADKVEILSGLYEGVTTGTPIALLIRNEDARSRDYANLLDTFRPGHADYTYWRKYGLRDPRGGGRARLGSRHRWSRPAQSRRNGCWAARNPLRRLDEPDGRHRDSVRRRGADLHQRVLAPNATIVAQLEEQMDALRKAGTRAARASRCPRKACRRAWVSRCLTSSTQRLLTR